MRILLGGARRRGCLTHLLFYARPRKTYAKGTQGLMTLEQMYVALLIGGLALLASIVATRLATRAGLPSLLLFLAIGVALGEDGLGLPDNLVVEIVSATESWSS